MCLLLLQLTCWGKKKGYYYELNYFNEENNSQRNNQYSYIFYGFINACDITHKYFVFYETDLLVFQCARPNIFNCMSEPSLG